MLMASEVEFRYRERLLQTYSMLVRPYLWYCSVLFPSKKDVLVLETNKEFHLANSNGEFCPLIKSNLDLHLKNGQHSGIANGAATSQHQRAGFNYAPSAVCAVWNDFFVCAALFDVLTAATTITYPVRN